MFAYRYVRLFLEPQDFGVETQSLLLLFDEHAGHDNSHSTSPFRLCLFNHSMSRGRSAHSLLECNFVRPSQRMSTRSAFSSTVRCLEIACLVRFMPWPSTRRTQISNNGWSSRLANSSRITRLVESAKA